VSTLALVGLLASPGMFNGQCLKAFHGMLRYHVSLRAGPVCCCCREPGTYDKGYAPGPGPAAAPESPAAQMWSVLHTLPPPSWSWVATSGTIRWHAVLKTLQAVPGS